MKVTLGIEIGSSCTRVSAVSPGMEGRILSREFEHVLLFLGEKERVMGEAALTYIYGGADKHANSFTANFVGLMNLHREVFEQGKEGFFTYATLKGATRGRLVPLMSNLGRVVSPEKCLLYFLRGVLDRLKKDHFRGLGVEFEARVAVEDGGSTFDRQTFAAVFGKLGVSAWLCRRSLALASLYAELHRGLARKNVLLVDFGYTNSRFSLVSVTPEGVGLLAWGESEVGLRDFDFEVYRKVLREVNSTYLVNYQKDKNVRFQLMSRIARQRKAFALNQDIVLNLQSACDDVYKNQVARVSLEQFQALNVEHLETIEKSLGFFLQEKVKAKGLEFEDVQILGGGAKLRFFREMVGRTVDPELISDRLVFGFACSRGLLFIDRQLGEVASPFGEKIDFDIIKLPPELQEPKSIRSSSKIELDESKRSPSRRERQRIDTSQAELAQDNKEDQQSEPFDDLALPPGAELLSSGTLVRPEDAFSARGQTFSLDLPDTPGLLVRLRLPHPDRKLRASVIGSLRPAAGQRNLKIFFDRNRLPEKASSFDGAELGRIEGDLHLEDLRNIS